MNLVQPQRLTTLAHDVILPTTLGGHLGLAGALRLCSDSAVVVVPGKLAALDPAGGPLRQHAGLLRERTDQLFKEHSPYVARLAYRLLGRDDEVDDIVQDVFISLFRHLDGIRQVEAVRAWLATTTVRVARRRLRLRRVGFLLRLRERVNPMELEGSGASGEDRAALWKVHRALKSVATNSRIAWVLRYLEQESIEDVARLCGCSPSTAKRRIADAHGAVKRAVSDE
jgi:RNA polymerase sigma-70 factor (ECF subfamily)